jgi:LemA protein
MALAGSTALYAAGAVVVLLLLVFAYYYNRFVQLENRMDNAWAQIDVQLKKRADLVPNLVETVQGYAEHEKEVFENVSESRERMMDANTPAEEAEAGNMMTDALKSIFAIAEDYPDLKASENFKELQEELAAIENKIAYARQHYNDAVLAYNNTVEQLPGALFATLLGKDEQEMLEIDTADRELPDVDFGTGAA